MSTHTFQRRTIPGSIYSGFGEISDGHLAGRTGQVSFDRLMNEVLVQAGELQPSERVSAFRIDTERRIIQYTVENSSVVVRQTRCFR